MAETTVVGTIARRSHFIPRRLPRPTPLVAISIAFLVVTVVTAALAPWISPYHPDAQDLASADQLPSAEHLLGTDSFGRDILSRLLHAGATSITAALLAVSIAAGIGVVTGLIAGYLGGVVDSLMSRWVDVMLSLPGLIFVFAIIGIIGPGLTGAMITFGVLMSPTFFRVVRASTADFRNRTFVLAARSIGARQSRILGIHILPNTFSPIVVQLTLGLGGAIVAEASLSFLGLGAQMPQSSWGSMVRQAFDALYIIPWELVPPATMIIVTILCLSLVGDAITDAFARQGRKGR